MEKFQMSYVQNEAQIEIKKNGRVVKSAFKRNPRTLRNVKINNWNGTSLDRSRMMADATLKNLMVRTFDFN